MIQHDYIHLPASIELANPPTINVQLWQFRLVAFGVAAALFFWAYTNATVAWLLLGFVAYCLIALPVAIIAGKSIAFGMGGK